MDVDNDDNATMEDAMRGGTKCKGSVEEACCWMSGCMCMCEDDANDAL